MNTDVIKNNNIAWTCPINKPSTMKKVISNYCCFLFIATFVFVVTLFGNTTKASIFNVQRISNENAQWLNKNFSDAVRWTWRCSSNRKCERNLLVINEEQTSLETCLMMCSLPQLWPKPESIKFAYKNSSTFHKQQIVSKLHSPKEVSEMLQEALDIFLQNLPSNDTVQPDDEDVKTLVINIHVNTNDEHPKISTNESYDLYVQKIYREKVLINLYSETYFGARHGLETLSQLIWFDSVSRKLRILHDLKIQDRPKFPHRGISVDTARNFFPIYLLRKIIDGMSATKLNVLHLHLTDSVSFPIILPNNKRFAEYGAYSPEMTYSPEDIKNLINYAKIRGIRTILEIDAPSHVNEGWPDGLVICGEDNVLNGHLNPDNENTLQVLQDIYQDLLDLGSDRETFHIGGDEVNLNCWRNTNAAKGFSDLHQFWAHFANQMVDRVKTANNGTLPKNVVIWSSPLTDSYITYLENKENLVIQYWFGNFETILRNGYKIVFSTVGQWYLDCGFGPWKPSMTNGVCDPYTPWQKFYRYRPWDRYPNYMRQVLGGEACLWSEQVSIDTLETRIWPRSAAFAERLWSDIPHFDEYDVYTRLVSHSQRLHSRGIEVAAIWPKWCSMNPGKC